MSKHNRERRKKLSQLSPNISEIEGRLAIAAKANPSVPVWIVLIEPTQTHFNGHAVDNAEAKLRELATSGEQTEQNIYEKFKLHTSRFNPATQYVVVFLGTGQTAVGTVNR